MAGAEVEAGDGSGIALTTGDGALGCGGNAHPSSPRRYGDETPGFDFAVTGGGGVFGKTRATARGIPKAYLCCSAFAALLGKTASLAVLSFYTRLGGTALSGRKLHILQMAMGLRTATFSRKQSRGDL